MDVPIDPGVYLDMKIQLNAKLWVMIVVFLASRVLIIIHAASSGMNPLFDYFRLTTM